MFDMTKKTAVLHFLKRYLLITSGCAIFALGIALFLDPNKVASGGVSGLAIILNYATQKVEWLNTGVWIVFLNIPLFILGFIFFGRKFILSTIYSTVVSSLFIELFSFIFKKFLPLTDDIVIAGVVGGALMGLGMGIIFRLGSTTGGTDIVVKILRKKFRFIKMGIISLIVDLVIIGISTIVFREFSLAFYTVISLIITTVSLDWVLYGGDSAKLMYIITDSEHAEKISEKILKELDISATYINGEGAYTGEGKRIIMCAIKKYLYPKLKDYVHEIDPGAFTIVTSAKEIYGEGYKNHKDGDL